MTDRRRRIGDRGERIAAEHLAENGWTVRATNWSCELGELDIVASRDEEFHGETSRRLAFVEVKSRSSTSGPPPELNVDRRKRRKIAQLAEIFIDQNEDQPVSAQFDVVSVVFTGEAPDVEHFENAFDAIGRLN